MSPVESIGCCWDPATNWLKSSPLVSGLPPVPGPSPAMVPAAASPVGSTTSAIIRIFYYLELHVLTWRFNLVMHAITPIKLSTRRKPFCLDRSNINREIGYFLALGSFFFLLDQRFIDLL